MSRPAAPPFAVVVNDDATQLKLLSELVGMAGLAARPFPGAEAALQEFSVAASVPSLVVTDLHMSGIDGWRFCRLLRSPEYAALNRVPIVVVSATFAGVDTERIAADLGAQAFFAAPVDPQRFVRQVQSLLQGEPLQTSPRVLVVEDSEPFAGAIQRALAGAGYEVTAVSTHRAAAEVFAAASFDVAVLDHHLPDGTGDDLLEVFRASRPGCVCLMMTTDPSAELALGWMRRGAAAYLRKPFEPAYLVELCSKARRERALLRSHELVEQRTRALRESSELFKTVVHNSADLVLLTDADGVITYVSAQCEGVFGHPPELFVGRVMPDIIHPEDAASYQATWERVYQRRQTVRDLEYRVLDAEGAVRWLSHTAGPIVLDGQVLGVQNTLRNITDRKQAERALRELKVKVGSQQLYSVLVELASDGFWLLDKDFLTVYVNPAIEAMFGYTRAEMTGRSWYDFGDPEWVARAQELEKRRSSGVQESHRFLFRHKSGRPVLTRIATTPLYDEHGAFGGALGILSDITKQEEAAAALEVKEMLDTVAQSAGVGMCLINPDYTVAWYNSMYVAWFGALELTRGRNCFEVFEHRDGVCPGCPARVSFETASPATFEREGVQTLAGVDRVVTLSTTPICDAHGKVLQVVEVAQDVTERRQADEERARLQAQLQHAQKMESVGRLAGGVAHDFNNMLEVILGYAELALSNPSADAGLRSDLEEIKRAGERSADLTRQLLAFARRQAIAPKVLDLNAAVEGMLKMLRRLIGEDIDLAWLPAPVPWPVKVDPSQLDQLLANLCVNARDAIEGVGRITIETTNTVIGAEDRAGLREIVPGDYVLLSICDDGCGMDSDTLGKLFEPFFTTKDKGKGTGLGLATVYGIVKQNNGFIDVSSRPGQGSIFRLYLPRHVPAASDVVQSTPPAPTSRGQETILLLEDEPAVRRVTERILVSKGYLVLSASTPALALRLAGEHSGRIDLLITDVVMPGMSGQELAQQLLARYPHLKCMFMSGYTADVIAQQGIVGGFIEKPFSVKELAVKVRGVLDEAQSTSRRAP